MAAETPEVIRKQIDQTRAALEQKLDSLEDRAIEAVQTATNVVCGAAECIHEAVEDAVDTVKETVQESGAAVKHKFDRVADFAKHYPALLCIGAVGIGYLVARLFVRSTAAPAASTPPAPAPSGPVAPTPPQGTVSIEPAAAAAVPAAPAKSKLAEFAGVMVGIGGAVARELVVNRASAELRRVAIEAIDRLTAELGGEVIPYAPSADKSPGEQNSPPGQTG